MQQVGRIKILQELHPRAGGKVGKQARSASLILNGCSRAAIRMGTASVITLDPATSASRLSPAARKRSRRRMRSVSIDSIE